MTDPTPKAVVVPQHEIDQHARTFRHTVGDAVIRRHEALLDAVSPEEKAEGRLLSLIVESVGEYGSYDGPPEGQPHPLAAPQASLPPVEGVREGDFHTRLMNLIREEIQRQHTEAFTEENDFDLIIQSGPERPSCVKIDTSALAEAILPHVSSSGSSGPIEMAYRALWSHSSADTRLHEARRLLLDVLGGQGSKGQREALSPVPSGGGEPVASEPKTAEVKVVPVERRMFRHKTRGSTYTLIGNGRAQCSPSGLLDDEHVVIYQGEDGSLWARRYAEFWDGRFEEIEAPASPPAETGEGVDDDDGDPVLPDTPLARTIYKHFVEVHMLSPDEAADATGELLTALSAQPVSPSKGVREPTAWLYTETRWKDGPRYRLSMKRQAIAPEDANEFEITEDALYTHPASDQSDTERMRAALEPFAEIARRYLTGGLHADLQSRAPSLINLMKAEHFYAAHSALEGSR